MGMTAEQIRGGLQTQVQCRNCGGFLRLARLFDYIAGYQAAGGNPVDVWGDWDMPHKDD